MIFTIPAGKHRARPFRFGLWWRRTHFSWMVRFDESCKYYLGKVDQLDCNKLVGIGYLWSHHKDSARFGWRYDVESDRIILSAYCYVNGRRVIEHIGYVKLGQWCRIHLSVATYYYHFNIEVMEDLMYKSGGNVIVDHDNNKRLQYRLGLYFGGNQKAPHQMKVKIEKT